MTRPLTQVVRGLVATGVLAAGLVTPSAVAAPDHHTAPAATVAPSSTVGGTISRAEVDDRMRSWIGNKKITYSQSGRYAGPGGVGSYRRDCSGFVSMALHLSDAGGGPNTVGLADVVHRISYAELEPGDLLGHLGAGSSGDNGHVRIFVGWANAAHTRLNAAEQGWVSNPDYPHVSVRPAREYLDSGDELLPYRYDHITD